MIKSALGKVTWVGRTASMVLGLALVLALVVGMADAALGANGQAWILGQINKATSTTNLTGSVAGGPALQVSNLKTESGSKGLQLNVADRRAPLAVNAGAGKATNLNADKLDGLDSTDVGRQQWAVINADGTVVRSSGTSGFTGRLGKGHYLVAFDNSVHNCAWVATTTGGFAGQTGVIQSNFDFSTDVQVFTTDSSGTSADMPFHLIVTCP